MKALPDVNRFEWLAAVFRAAAPAGCQSLYRCGLPIGGAVGSLSQDTGLWATQKQTIPSILANFPGCLSNRELRRRRPIR